MDAKPHSPRDRRRSIFVMLAAVALFAMMDAGLKALSERYPPFQVATLRGAASLPPVLAWSLATVGWKPLLRVRWPLHVLRGIIGIAMMASFVYALKRMPLSTAYTIFFIAPLLITAMRSDMVIASSWSCVTNTVVVWVSSCSLRNHPRSSARTRASRAPNGSSSSSTFG